MSDDKAIQEARATQITRALSFDAAKITSATAEQRIGDKSELVIRVLVDTKRLAAIENDLAEHKADIARIVDNPGALIDWAAFFERRERLIKQEVVRMYAIKIEAPAYQTLWSMFPSKMTGSLRFL